MLYEDTDVPKKSCKFHECYRRYINIPTSHYILLVYEYSNKTLARVARVEFKKHFFPCKTQFWIHWRVGGRGCHPNSEKYVMLSTN